MARVARRRGMNPRFHKPALVRRLITEVKQADAADDCGRSPHEPKQAEKDHIYVGILGLSLGDVLFHISNFMIQTLSIEDSAR
jgi:hypothetical protein